MKFNIYLILVFSFLLLACKKHYISQVYIGSYYDDNYRYSLPLIIEFGAGDTVLITKINDTRKNTTSIFFKQGDSLINKKKRYSLNINNESLILTNKMNKFYFKVVQNTENDNVPTFTNKEIKFDNKRIDSFEARQKWRFTDDSVFFYRQYFYQNEICYHEYESSSYKFYSYNFEITLLLLIDKGRPFQIFGVDYKNKTKEILLFDYKDATELIGNLKTIQKKKDENKNKFNVSEKQHIYQYYQFNTKPRPIFGYNELRKSIIDKFKSVFINGEDGFITFRFVINTEGEVGRFELEQMNNMYLETYYEKKVIVKLLNWIVEQKWMPAMIEEERFDCNYFLIFKIENNKVIDVYV